MALRALFPTLVYEARLAAADGPAFNRRLLAECLQYREDDTAGRAWSATRYPGGIAVRFIASMINATPRGETACGTIAPSTITP